MFSKYTERSGHSLETIMDSMKYFISNIGIPYYLYKDYGDAFGHVAKYALFSLKDGMEGDAGEDKDGINITILVKLLTAMNSLSVAVNKFADLGKINSLLEKEEQDFERNEIMGEYTVRYYRQAVTMFRQIPDYAPNYNSPGCFLYDFTRLYVEWQLERGIDKVRLGNDMITLYSTFPHLAISMVEEFGLELQDYPEDRAAVLGENGHMRVSVWQTNVYAMRGYLEYNKLLADTVYMIHNFQVFYRRDTSEHIFAAFFKNTGTPAALIKLIHDTVALVERIKSPAVQLAGFQSQLESDALSGIGPDLAPSVILAKEKLLNINTHDIEDQDNLVVRIITEYLKNRINFYSGNFAWIKDEVNAIFKAFPNIVFAQSIRELLNEKTQSVTTEELPLDEPEVEIAQVKYFLNGQELNPQTNIVAETYRAVVQQLYGGDDKKIRAVGKSLDGLMKIIFLENAGFESNARGRLQKAVFHTNGRCNIIHVSADNIEFTYSDGPKSDFVQVIITSDHRVKIEKKQRPRES